MRHAFTLIELLVVVLIIGILSAIALPQYHLAVAKSRIASYLPYISHLVQLEQSHHLANGQYTYDFEQLDPDIFNLCSGHAGMNERYNCPHTVGFMLAPITDSYDGTTCQVILRYCQTQDCHVTSSNSILSLAYNAANAQLIGCTSNNTLGERLCKTFSRTN